MLKTPPMQTATATIENYCARLHSATLLEDRRAAIEGLRSVAKQYPASVASGSLRELILILRRDGLGESTKQDGDSRRSGEGGGGGGDVDTTRLVLETLLRLFEPEPDSPEAGDEIALFLADAFCMRQENISTLLNLLDPAMPYSDNLSCKLSVQILSAICAARPDRLQDSILGAPLGISRLVGVLDNARDDVRYAGLELLTNLTGGANEELRKIVAFEDVFSRVFALIRLEGGLAEAGIVAQDCLALLVNLVKGSTSNQAMFRESGCVSQLTESLREIFPPREPEAAFLVDNRIRAGWGLLQLLRQLLVHGETGTFQNQTAFFRTGTAQILMDLAFHADLPSIIRVAAFRAGADLVQYNAAIQVNFATIQIEETAPAKDTLPRPDRLQVNGHSSRNASARNSARPSTEKQRTYIIEALLDLVLRQQKSPHELRVAACTVIQAYLVKHNEIRAHFLQRATAGYKEREQAPNVLSSLLRHSDDSTGVVLAAWTVQDLVSQNRDAKTAFANVQEGNVDEDEDVLSAVQTLGSELQQRIQQSAELGQIAAYATTLAVLLWDFADGINLLLAEGSSLLQTLIDAAKAGTGITAGLSATLLGIIYEFSTKDSPIPRKTLSTLLTDKLGRDKYLEALTELRKDPSIRDYDLPVDESQRLELSESFFNLFLNEYARLRRSIDKDPGIEVLPYAAAEAGVQRDILDELRGKIDGLESALSQSQQDAAQSSQQAQQDKLQSEQKFASLQKESEQEKVELKKQLGTAAAEVERIRAVISKMQTSHDEAVRKSDKQHLSDLENVNVKHSRELASIRQETDRKTQQAKQQAEQGFLPVRQDFERRLAELGNAHRAEQAGHKDVRERLESLTLKTVDSDKTVNDLNSQLQDLRQRHSDLERASQQHLTRAETADSELATLKKSLEDKATAFDAMKTTVAELRAEIKGKDQELETERSGFADLEKELAAARSTSDSLKSDLDAARAQTAKLEKELSTARSGPVKAEKQLASEQSKTADLDKQLSALRTKFSNAEKELSSLRSKSSASEKELSAFQSKSSASEKELAALRSKATESEKELSALRSRTTELEKDLETARSKSAELEKEAEAAKKQGQKAAASPAAKTNKKDAEAAKKAEKLKEFSDTLAAEIKTLKSEADKATTREAELIDKAAASDKALQAATEAEKSAKDELDNLLLVLSELGSKRDEYKDKVKELGGEVTDEEEDDSDGEDSQNDDVD